jgi:hypothetical protein
MAEVRESGTMNSFAIVGGFVTIVFAAIAIIILFCTFPNIVKQINQAMKETTLEPVTRYTENVINIMPHHTLILAIILAVPGVIIPICVTMWSNYLGSIFNLTKYLEKKTGDDWSEIKNLSKSLITNSKDTSEKLRVIYIFSLCTLSIAFMFLIISIFFVSAGGINLSIIFLTLCYMALLIFFIIFLIGLYFVLFTHKPFPRISEITEKISNLVIK